MNHAHRVITFILIVLLFQVCSPKVAPYAHGPVMSEKRIKKSFEPILQFMDVKPGIVFADVGASSGALTVMMATLMDSATVYIQDIDQTNLQEDNLNKIIDFYSKQSNLNLRNKNKFQLVIGDRTHSNLPNETFDLIYSNATMHVFDSPDTILTDLSKKLKPNGKLFIRDSFKNDHGAGNFCSDPSCAKPLITIDEFLITMERNRFKLVKKSPDMSGYPLFGFAKQQ
jgi:ubiquinone/menaquinone biosynthesis C-methylase UbiE